MFNRLKGFDINSFIDSKINEEQNRQSQPARSGNAGTRGGTGRTESPARGGSGARGSSRLRVPDVGEGTPAGKGPDPAEFVIGEDASDVSRTATPTPRPVKESAEEPLAEKGNMTGKRNALSPTAKGKEKAEYDELPDAVRQKLVKFENLSTKYQDLLRNYRTAHARVSTIEPFEATLREHTPLTSITEPGALVEFLSQRSLQSDMVLEELRRLTGEHKDAVRERDELKVKLQDVEKKAKDASDQAAGLREEREGKPATSQLLSVSDAKATKEGKKPAGIAEDEFFSYEIEQKRSLEDQIKEYESEIEQNKEYINELSTENASLRRDFDMCQLDLDAMKNKIRIKDDKMREAQDEMADTRAKLEEAGKAREAAQEQEQEAASTLAQTEGELVNLQYKLKEYKYSLEGKAALAEENLKKYQAEHAENLKNGTYSQRDERGMENLRSLVNTMRDHAKEADEGKAQAEALNKDLRHYISMLESEASERGELLTQLRGQQAAAETYKRKMSEAEHERDNAQRLAESKKGHEAAVASLRSQLKRAEKDRDAAYQMILDCGKCTIPAKEEDKVPQTPTETSTPEMRSRVGSPSTEVNEASTRPTEVSTPSMDVEPETGEAKKKSKKKKWKSKKKAALDTSSEVAQTPSIDELIANPDKCRELLAKEGVDRSMVQALLERSIGTMRQESESKDEGLEAVLRHHEELIELRDQTIAYNNRMLQEKNAEIDALHHKIGEQDAAIERLDRRLKGEEELKEEIEQLRDEVTELGSQATDAKHELKIVKQQKQKLQEEINELQAESDGQRKTLKDAEAQHDELVQRCKTFEAEITQRKNSPSTASSVSSDELQAAKEKVGNLEKEKVAGQVAIGAAEKQVEELKAQHSASSAEYDTKHASLSAQYDELKKKAAGLERHLTVANQLAQTRFKDLSDVHKQHEKLQTELEKLREEAAELKGVKADLEKANATIKRLDGKERDLRSEIAVYKSQATEKDGEIASLKERAKKSDDRSSALEESYENARKDLEQSQAKRDEATEMRDKLQADLKKTETDLKQSNVSLDDLGKQVNKFRDEANSLREKLQVKDAQHASPQSQMDSNQEQSRELATQMREIRERNESLEEELEDTRRLLSERSREGETMRRMLADVEARADSRVKEMRERMDLAIEERDRAEDEASSIGRRKARELEELRMKLREAEHEASRASEAREDAERKERDLRIQHGDVQKRAAQTQEELAEVRSALAQLQSTLDESERQTAALEREKAQLRSDLEAGQTRLEKLQKSSKAMSEELRTLQSANKHRQGSVQSSRSSWESLQVASPRVTSPAPRTSNGTPIATTGGANAAETVDYVYLKNVLLQFLETKEKKHQMQLVPVLGRLLHLNKQDQQKWEAAVAAR